MKKIYTLSMSMMLAVMPAVAQQTMQLHSPVRSVTTPKMQVAESVTYNAPETVAMKKADAQSEPSMTIGYCGEPVKAVGLGCEETGVGIMFPADYLKNFVGSQITALNVAAPYSKTLSSGQSFKNSLTTAKIMVCNEMNGTPVVESDVTLGDVAFEINELKFDTPYTIEAGKDVYLYVIYEGAKTTSGAIEDLIMIVDTENQQDPVSPNSAYLYSKMLIQGNNITTQQNMEWKEFADLFGFNFCITATVAGDNLPQNIATPAAVQPQLNIKPNQEFEVLAAVKNGGANGMENVELTLKIGDQAPQSVTTDVYDQMGQPASVGFGEYGIVRPKFTCTAEGVNLPYSLSVTKVNGVENANATTVIEGTLTCIEQGYPTNVVIEEFTSTSCPYCPIGITGLEEMKEKYGADGRVIPLAAHYSQSSKDPMNVCDGESDCYYGFVLDIVAAQGGAGAPSAYIMRQFDNTVYPHPEELDYYMEQWLQVEAIAEVKATVEPTEEETDVTLKVTVTPAIDDESAYGISYTIVEDDLGPYRQVNGFAGASYDALGWQNKPASVNMLFNDVVRPGSKYRPVPNSTMKTLKKGESVEWSTTVDVSAVKNLENYSIVAMLINKSNGQIANAYLAKGVASGIEAVAAEGKAIAAGVQGGVKMFTSGNIYTIDGRAVAMGVNGMVELPAGLYIVATPAGNAKVMVR